uniref:Uncharacterized protein n=1 Tax=Vespula pensylvanica TaxID=30213 RepID=A0A834KHS8_VESPE|nr:hypothetical protein H0235_014975 [Vespula pensylvanica]
MESPAVISPAMELHNESAPSTVANHKRDETIGKRLASSTTIPPPLPPLPLSPPPSPPLPTASLRPTTFLRKCKTTHPHRAIENIPKYHFALKASTFPQMPQVITLKNCVRSDERAGPRTKAYLKVNVKTKKWDALLYGDETETQRLSGFVRRSLCLCAGAATLEKETVKSSDCE